MNPAGMAAGVGVVSAVICVLLDTAGEWFVAITPVRTATEKSTLPTKATRRDKAKLLLDYVWGRRLLFPRFLSRPVRLAMTRAWPPCPQPVRTWGWHEPRLPHGANPGTPDTLSGQPFLPIGTLLPGLEMPIAGSRSAHGSQPSSSVPQPFLAAYSPRVRSVPWMSGLIM
jgi:hypothetical protein